MRSAAQLQEHGRTTAESVAYGRRGWDAQLRGGGSSGGSSIFRAVILSLNDDLTMDVQLVNAADEPVGEAVTGVITNPFEGPTTWDEVAPTPIVGNIVKVARLADGRWQCIETFGAYKCSEG